MFFDESIEYSESFKTRQNGVWGVRRVRAEETSFLDATSPLPRTKYVCDFAVLHSPQSHDFHPGPYQTRENI